LLAVEAKKDELRDSRQERNVTMQSILLCSIDSFFAATGIGLFGCSERQRRQLIGAFALCDFGATAVGLYLHSYLAEIYGGSSNFFLSLALLALALVLTIFIGRRSLGVVAWIPILLSLDNFLAGLFGGSVHTPESQILAGLVSGLLAWAGFETARLARPLLSRRNAIVASVSLIVLAFVFVN
jgi:hypothetical protein